MSVVRLDGLLTKHDPQGRAVAISQRSYDGTMVIGGRRGGSIVDIATGEALPGTSALASFMTTSRRMHERLLIDAGWLVVSSTVAMLVLIGLGLFMGLPRLANSLSGWHKGMAWIGLPLVILSPLTGLFMAMGVSFAPPRSATPAEGGKPMALREAVQIASRSHDLSGLVWLRPQGNRMLLRVVEGGEFRVYSVSREGTSALPRNWPRLLHEGNFAGLWSALMNVVTSFILIGLLVTGVWIWARRSLRHARHRQARARAAATA